MFNCFCNFRWYESKSIAVGWTASFKEQKLWKTSKQTDEHSADWYEKNTAGSGSTSIIAAGNVVLTSVGVIFVNWCFVEGFAKKWIRVNYYNFSPSQGWK